MTALWDRAGFLIVATLFTGSLMARFRGGRLLSSFVGRAGRLPGDRLDLPPDPVGPAAAGPVHRDHLVSALEAALGLVFDPYNLLVMLLAGTFGLFVGAMPGLTATMATALLVPVTFFMSPEPAIAAIVTATAMAIYAGDIPGALVRIPGTPASAAYVEDSYRMTLRGEAATVLGAGLVFSVVGGHLRLDRPGRGRTRHRRVRAQLQLLRVFLAGPARPLLCGVHLLRIADQGHRLRAARPVPRHRRHRPDGRAPALHLRQCRADGRGQPDPDHDRHVRGQRDPALGDQLTQYPGGRRPPGRQRLQRAARADAPLLAQHVAQCHRRDRYRRAARGRRRHRGLGHLCHGKAPVQDAGEVRHRLHRGRDGAEHRQQCEPGRGLDPGTGVRHSGRTRSPPSSSASST